MGTDTVYLMSLEYVAAAGNNRRHLCSCFCRSLLGCAIRQAYIMTFLCFVLSKSPSILVRCHTFQNYCKSFAATCITGTVDIGGRDINLASMQSVSIDNQQPKSAGAVSNATAPRPPSSSLADVAPDRTTDRDFQGVQLQYERSHTAGQAIASILPMVQCLCEPIPRAIRLSMR